MRRHMKLVRKLSCAGMRHAPHPICQSNRRNRPRTGPFSYLAVLPGGLFNAAAPHGAKTGAARAEGGPHGRRERGRERGGPGFPAWRQ